MKGYTGVVESELLFQYQSSCFRFFTRTNDLVISDKENYRKPIMSVKKVFVPIGILTVGVVGLLIMSSLKTKLPKKPVINKSQIVETVSARTEDVQFQIRSQGVVKPRTESNLVSQVSGVINYISPKFVVGGYFKKGEILLKIEDVDYQIALEQSQARLDGDKARLAQEQARVEKEWALTGRAKKDAPALALRLPNLKEAQAQVRGSEADLRSARLGLERATIRAPYDGILRSKFTDLGQYVNVGTQLATSYAVDYAEVRLSLSDRDLAYLELPQPGHEPTADLPRVIFTASHGNQLYTWHGQIVRTEGIIDEKSRVHYAVAQIDDPYNIENSSGLPPLSVGTFVKAEIEGIWGKSVVRLPREVLQGVGTVMVMDAKNKLRVRQVDILRAETDWIYVSDGIAEGEKVITTSLETRVEGMAVKEQVNNRLNDTNDQTLVAGKTDPEKLIDDENDKNSDATDNPSSNQPMSSVSQ